MMGLLDYIPIVGCGTSVFSAKFLRIISKNKNQIHSVIIFFLKSLTTGLQSEWVNRWAGIKEKTTQSDVQPYSMLSFPVQRYV